MVLTVLKTDNVIEVYSRKIFYLKKGETTVSKYGETFLAVRKTNSGDAIAAA